MRQTQQGVGLIEVLVSLLILAVAILGFSALQMQAIKSTAESVDRSQTLLMMRSLAEKIRSNPTAISAYKTAFTTYKTASDSSQDKSTNLSPPSKLCISSETALCSPNEIAIADVWRIKQQLDALEIKMDLQPCPSAGGGGANAASNIMYSYCLITAWGDTMPTIGTDSDPSDGRMDCLTSRDTSDPTNIKTGGTYYPKATCMFLEVN